MAIELQVYSGDTPSSLTDWQLYLASQQAILMAINNPFRTAGAIVPKGSIFYVMGAIYKAISDTAITGTSSNYVKFTVSGNALVPSFASSINTVTWNKTWNGYYNAVNELFIFDELRAYKDDLISFPTVVNNFKPTAKDMLSLMYSGLYNSSWLTLLSSVNPNPITHRPHLIGMTDPCHFKKSVTLSRQGTSTSYYTIGEFYLQSMFNPNDGSQEGLPLESILYSVTGLPAGSTLKIYDSEGIYLETLTAFSGTIAIGKNITTTKRTIKFDAKQLISSQNVHTEVANISFGIESVGSLNIIQATTLYLAGNLLT